MGKKLTVYMIDGTEYGPRTAEIGNWSGKAIYATRSTINKIIKRPEFDNPGVYCLKSEPTSENYSERVYIGEAENIRNRLKQHLADSKKDFSEVIFFISKDELLTKAHIRYLETRLIEETIEAKTAEIDNGNVPSLPSLHEADIDDMEYFLEQVRLILPVMGSRFLVSSVVHSSEEAERQIDEKNYFYISSKGIKARMYESDKGYVVKKGSLARKFMNDSISENYVKLKHKLLESGSLVEEGKELVFTEDYVFSSLSAASNIVLGAQTAGPLKWKTKDGKTYKELEQEKL